MATIYNLTQKRSNIKTLLPQSGVYKTWNNVISAINVKNRIGELKRLEFEVVSDVALNSANVYLNPALFVANGIIGPTGGAGSHYWSYPLPAILTPGNVFTCALSTTGTSDVDLIRNFSIKITIINDFNIKIVFDYAQIYDTDGYLDFNNESNHDKLLKDKKNAPAELTVAGSSVYNSVKRDARLYMYVEKQGSPLDNGFVSLKVIDYTAGFYNHNQLQAPPYFTNPNWILERGAVIKTNLSNVIDTDVTFKVDSPSTVSKVVMWLIRTDKFDNFVDFQFNYEYDLQEIETSSTSSTAISAPMTSPVLDSGATFKVTFKIKASLLTYNAKYRMIAIVYRKEGEDDGNYDANSFISEEIVVNEIPCYYGNGIDFFGRLSDYNREFDGNRLECVIEERLRSKLQMEYPLDKWKNDIFNRLGLVVPNDLRKYLSEITVEIYEEHNDVLLGTVRNIYDLKTAVKSGPLTYTVPSGMTLSFATNECEFWYDFRNRYESGTLNLQTLVNGINVTPQMDNQYWGGKSLILDWKLKFNYFDYFAPFSDEIIFRQFLDIKDYGQIAILNQIPEGGSDLDLEKTTFCQGDLMCLFGIVTPTDSSDPEDYRLIVNIEKAPGNILTIEEAEAWVGSELTQLTTDKIYAEEVQYGTTLENSARFCVNTNKLLLNSQYKISVLAKKFVDRCRRVTEVSDPRKTEYGSQRVIENCNN